MSQKIYTVSPRGHLTREWIGFRARFPKGSYKVRPGFNRKLAEVLTNQALEERFDLAEIQRVAPKARLDLFQEVPCDYGIRIRGQLNRVVNQLREDRESRRAVLTFTRPDDEVPPCILAIQFLIRDEKVETIAFLRSWDFQLGLPYDLHLMIGLARFIAQEMEIGEGEITVFAGSAHEYQTNAKERGKHE